ncbi:MAG: 1,4-alpha-glucan branching protein GlgB, partial [Pontibacter sp.]|nr:1,4-alpha-glucan branching protein GlgB [Pontibacter sp.]
IDVLHQHGVGVILDWVPSHFPSDEHGLAYFDGTHLFEHADPRKGFHPDWNSYIFNYGRNEVRSFLISNALFWLEKYHADGLRVDAVASMLYLDYSRREGEWIPNEHGGRENLEAISFLKDFNQAVHERFPDVQTVAEESTAWPAVTGKVEQGGLGFNMKWMMGWMHDTLHYFSKDPIYRRHHQGEITFSLVYAFSERFMLPLSHDEVVHGKGALARKMPGDEWQAFANLRALYAYMYAHPGAKLLFMGCEFGQTSEWNHDIGLDWHLLQYGYHQGIQESLRDLNAIYKAEPALYARAFEPEGFEWVDFQDAHNSVLSFIRKGTTPSEELLVVCNLTPVLHEHYKLGVPHLGEYVQVFNSDDGRYGGSNVHNTAPVQAVPETYHGRENSIVLKLPPLAVVYFKLKS